MKTRCSWSSSDPLYIDYHDHEWGVPVHEDQHLFEMLVLEGAQAGLSWLTILRKRQNFRKAFEMFDPQAVAKYKERKIQSLLKDEGIIRNRLKIDAAIQNAQRFLQVQKEFGSFDTYIWKFVDGQPVKNAWRESKQIPPKTEASDRMSKDLQKRGFKFVGSTICYAFMQACGLVNDHLVSCFRYEEV